MSSLTFKATWRVAVGNADQYYTQIHEALHLKKKNNIKQQQKHPQWSAEAEKAGTLEVVGVERRCAPLSLCHPDHCHSSHCSGSRSGLNSALINNAPPPLHPAPPRHFIKTARHLSRHLPAVPEEIKIMLKGSYGTVLEVNGMAAGPSSGFWEV